MDIRKEREQRKLTRKQVADRLGVSVRTVESWEYGLRNPSEQVRLLVEAGALDNEE